MCIGLAVNSAVNVRSRWFFVFIIGSITDSELRVAVNFRCVSRLQETSGCTALSPDGREAVNYADVEQNNNRSFNRGVSTMMYVRMICVLRDPLGYQLCLTGVQQKDRSIIVSQQNCCVSTKLCLNKAESEHMCLNSCVMVSTTRYQLIVVSISIVLVYFVFVLSRCRELKYLLTKELGIVMRGEEMRRLVDAFDTTKVGTTTGSSTSAKRCDN